MTADAIAKALDGRKAGSGRMARCPAHNDRESSLAISAGDEGKVLVHCHAGCDQGRVIVALRARGLWDDGNHRRGRFVRREMRPVVDAPPNRADAKRTEAALRLWEASSPLPGNNGASELPPREVHGP